MIRLFKSLLIAAVFLPASSWAGGYVSYGLGYNWYDYDDYYPGYYGGYRHHGYRHHGYPRVGYGVGYGCCSGHSDGGDLLAGLLIGGLLGYALNQSFNDRPVNQPYSYSRPAVNPPISEPVVRTVKVRNPECLMTREYTGLITVNGEQQPAYGTKCMKPDGSWTYGALTLEPSF